MSTDLEERLWESENRYRLITENLDDVIWVVAREDGRYLYLSPAVEKLLGFSPAEMKKRSLQDALTPSSYQLALREWTPGDWGRIECGEASRRLELEMVRKDGSTVWTEMVIRPFTDLDGAVRILGITRDISKRKEWRDEREKLIKRLQESLASEEKLTRENKVLRGLLPICAHCKKIRDKSGVWHDLEEYIASRSEADFTHTICPDCAQNLYPNLNLGDKLQ